MTTIIGVRFKPNGKMYYFDPQDIPVETGTGVIVETARGLEYGECVQANTDVPDQTVVQPLKRMLRVATDADRKTLERNKKRADEAFIVCKRKIEERGLDMNLVTVECTFDMNKMLFYFTADGRVDFRELVKDLASVFRTRIELRQIGVRDEAKMIGGLGTCGRELCCSSYLEDFHPVSINMAKDQNLSLNPAKISGTCGRLMCCLKYEHEAYAELQKVTPKQGSVVDTPEGRGKVISTQMLRGTCKVQLDDSPEHSLTEFQCADCCVVKGACRNRQNIAALAEERRRREDRAAKGHAQAGQRGGYAGGAGKGHFHANAARHLQGAAGRQSGAFPDRVPVRRLLRGEGRLPQPAEHRRAGRGAPQAGGSRICPSAARRAVRSAGQARTRTLSGRACRAGKRFGCRRRNRRRPHAPSQTRRTPPQEILRWGSAGVSRREACRRIKYAPLIKEGRIFIIILLHE